MAQRRIDKEWKGVASLPIPLVQVFRPEDLFHWTLAILGDVGTPYQEGVFFVNVTFPYEYPFKPPKAAFLTQIYHPNISTHGVYCLPVLGNWDPCKTFRHLAADLLQLLTVPTPDDPLEPAIAQQYKEHRAAFCSTATEWTRKYAK